MTQQQQGAAASKRCVASCFARPEHDRPLVSVTASSAAVIARRYKERWVIKVVFN